MPYSYETADPINYALLKDFAKRLRTCPTDAEKRLWHILKADQLGVSFRRQHIIGEFIGFKVIRFTNEQVLFDIDNVINEIKKHLKIWNKQR